MGISLDEFFCEGEEVFSFSKKEKELVANLRTLPDDTANLALKMIVALNR